MWMQYLPNGREIMMSPPSGWNRVSIGDDNAYALWNAPVETLGIVSGTFAFGRVESTDELIAVIVSKA